VAPLGWSQVRVSGISSNVSVLCTKTYDCLPLPHLPDENLEQSKLEHECKDFWTGLGVMLSTCISTWL